MLAALEAWWSRSSSSAENSLCVPEEADSAPRTLRPPRPPRPPPDIMARTRAGGRGLLAGEWSAPGRFLVGGSRSGGKADGV
jgi:hypothetical protein